MNAVSEPLPEASASPLVGYVEALNSDTALGWAWCPGHSNKLRVELWREDAMLARTVADQTREDLARGGIGDGRHAFTLSIPPEAAGPTSNLRVLAYPLEGCPVQLGAPPALPPPEPLAPLQRSVDMLISSQRLLHRNLQAALLTQGPPVASALADIATAQVKLNETIATVELFVVRLETALLGRETSVSAPSRHGLSIAVGLSGLSLIASCIALARVLAGS